MPMPAQTRSRTTVVPVTSSGLSAWPTVLTRRWATLPGVPSRTALATATTGALFTWSSQTVACAATMPATPVTSPARANMRLGCLTNPSSPSRQAGRRAKLLRIGDDRAMPLRIGLGTDVHRLVPGRPMRIAGLDWPGEEVGPDGHSDGDVVLHAA